MNNNESPKVIVDALERGQIEVLRVLAKKNGAKVIRLSPLTRFGYSGANLFEAFFTQNRTGLPFVVKVHKRKEIESELKAFSEVNIFFEDCLALQSLKPALISKYGAVAYKKISCERKKKKILEFKDLILNFSISNTKLVKLVRLVYEDSCGEARKAAVKKPIVLHEEYERYFREHRARQRIKQALGTQTSEQMCKFLGSKITNPLRVLAKGFRRKLPCVVGPVHGDLHTSNIILDRNREPHLIDFDWAEREGHILKDYVLLENSIRFMIYPQYISPGDQSKADKALLREEGYKDIIKLDFSNPKATRLFHRLSRLVGAIRVAAKDSAYHHFNEYLAAQFLVLYGLLRYDSYNFFPALMTLGRIGGKLMGSEYVPRL